MMGMDENPPTPPKPEPYAPPSEAPYAPPERIVLPPLEPEPPASLWQRVLYPAAAIFAAVGLGYWFGRMVIAAWFAP
jgi:hypothetical protein